MKIQLHFLLLAFILVLKSGASYAQIEIFGEKGIVKEPEAWGAQMDKLTSFKGKNNVIYIERGTSPFGGVMFDLNYSLDFSKSKTITFSAYNPKPHNTLDEYSLLVGVRKNGKETDFQELKKIPIKSFDKWDDYHVEINPQEEIDYKSVIIIIQPSSYQKEAEGLEMFLTNVTVPGFIVDEVLVDISTDRSGKQIILDVLSHSDLKGKTKKSPFKVIKNGYKELSIRKAETYSRQIILYMEKSLSANDDIRLSYEKGKVMDNMENELKSFKHRVVRNNVPIDFEVYSDLNFNHKYVRDNFHGQRTALSKGATLPGNVEDMGMRVTLKENGWGGVLFSLKSDIDITKEQVYKLKVFIPQNLKNEGKVKLEFCLRKDQQSLKQLSKTVVLSTSDQWQELTFDFRGDKPQMKYFNSIAMILRPSFNAKNINGKEFFLKDFMGPEKLIN
ncbi:hypothetical protein [Flammeovirga sp. OC4]|uniref:hypothetical protein n=1 Tax=Flammeovirga sp. OC4 TaxID=1382345 RepID=UPI0005C6A667|nr:hypothetical protein [Flammeovirga sp. OC4]